VCNPSAVPAGFKQDEVGLSEAIPSAGSPKAKNAMLRIIIYLQLLGRYQNVAELLLQRQNY
jgi:hypothetical protein